MVGIYKIENLINHKKYIGQSVNIKRRWKDEKISAFNENDRGYNYPLSRAFRKYGIENFSFEILEECNIEELNNKEQYWIEYYDSFFNGYNQTLGGDSSKSQPKEKIIGVFKDLETTDMTHKEIAQKWELSTETVQGINTGRYWYRENIEYPIQKRCKILKEIKGKKYYCSTCGAEVYRGNTRCAKCAQIVSRKVERPSREELKQLIRTTPFMQIGKKFGVRDNTIRKWCIGYNLPHRVKDIQKISDEDWKNI